MTIADYIANLLVDAHRAGYPITVLPDGRYWIHYKEEDPMATSNGWIRVYHENEGKDRTSVHLTDPLVAKHAGTLPDGTRRWSAMTRDGRVAEATAPKLRDAEHQVRTELGVPHVNCCDPLDVAVASFRDALPEGERD